MIWNHLASVTFLGYIEASNLRCSVLHVTEISSVVIRSLLTRVYTADTDMLRIAFKDSQT